MNFIEDNKSFKIEFTDEEVDVIKKTKTLYFPENVAEDFAKNLTAG